MPVSQNTVSAVIEIVRSIQNRSSKNIAQNRVIQNVTAAPVKEPVLAPNSQNTAVAFDGQASIQALIIVTSQPIGVRINGAVAAIPCGSILVWMDTTITSLALDNGNAVAVTPEVWLVT